MNNARLTLEPVHIGIEEPKKNLHLLRQREEKVLRIITALQKLQDNKEWSTLKTEIFDSLADTTRALLLTESRKENPDTNRLNRLSGELKWAERYADLHRLEQEYKNELSNIKIMLHGTT